MNYIDEENKLLLMGMLVLFILAIIACFQSTKAQDFCMNYYDTNKVEIIIDRATVYQAVPHQTNSDNFTTASGFRLNTEFDHAKYRILAVSRDLLEIVSYGDTVFVSGTIEFDGYWIVHDTMNKRYTRTIDFLTDLNQPNRLYNNVLLTIK
jgi:3D (Asp-Asp-Asp) domain-containing protein